MHDAQRVAPPLAPLAGDLGAPRVLERIVLHLVVGVDPYDVHARRCLARRKEFRIGEGAYPDLCDHRILAGEGRQQLLEERRLLGGGLRLVFAHAREHSARERGVDELVAGEVEGFDGLLGRGPELRQRVGRVGKEAGSAAARAEEQRLPKELAPEIALLGAARGVGGLKLLLLLVEIPVLLVVVGEAPLHLQVVLRPTVGPHVGHACPLGGSGGGAEGGGPGAEGCRNGRGGTEGVRASGC
mmetsp:Transcript_25298/g.49308  ORF Transcript_25298/g.49308 Transcript_25298/m.49308 type:complete len:242 (-) Transcript_25298:155-880(-)